MDGLLCRPIQTTKGPFASIAVDEEYSVINSEENLNAPHASEKDGSELKKPKRQKHRDVTLLNCTGYHDINIQANHKTIRFEGKCARVFIPQQSIGSVNGIPVFKNDTTQLESFGLPGYQPDTFYIVSMLVAVNNRHRGDLLVPNPSHQVKNQGRLFISSFLSFADQFGKLTEPHN